MRDEEKYEKEILKNAYKSSLFSVFTYFPFSLISGFRFIVLRGFKFKKKKSALKIIAIIIMLFRMRKSRYESADPSL